MSGSDQPEKHPTPAVVHGEGVTYKNETGVAAGVAMTAVQQWMLGQTLPAGVRDPYFGNVVLLLHGEGANNGTVFTDSSTYNRTPAALGGSVVTSTSDFKFGSSGIFFPGAGAFIDYTAAGGLLDGSADWTKEFQLKPNAVDPTRRSVYDHRFDGSGANTGLAIDFTSSGIRVEMGVGSTLYSSFTMGFLTANVWQHLAVCRQGGLIRVYVNGVQSGTLGVAGSMNTPTTGSPKIRLGRRNDGSQVYSGSMDEVRFTAGVCRYPGGVTFTPPAAPFQDL